VPKVKKTEAGLKMMSDMIKKYTVC